MSRDFRHVDDLHDFIADLVEDASRHLDEPHIHRDITNEIQQERGHPALSFGLDSTVLYEHDFVELLTASQMRGTVFAACVEAARRHRRERAIGYPRHRVIGMLSHREKNPLWSCHADLLVIAAFLHEGYDRSQIHLLGPGKAEPDRSSDATARNIHPHTLIDIHASLSDRIVHQHYVRDGYVYAHMSISLEPRPAGASTHGPLEILSDHRSALRIHGHDLPDTILAGLVGQPLDVLLMHPVTDQVPDLRILEASPTSGKNPSLFITIERRRTFLAEPPAGADLSFAELGNDLLIDIGGTPVTVLPYTPDLHLARP